jgi:hypothetical protein
MDAIKHAVAAPFPKVAVDRCVRRKVLGQLPPLATGAIDIANGVENLAHVGHTAAPARTRRREHRLDERPLLVADVARIATAARLMGVAMIVGPHGSPLIRLP